jgi:hypothetical protein
MQQQNGVTDEAGTGEQRQVLFRVNGGWIVLAVFAVVWIFTHW